MTDLSWSDEQPLKKGATSHPHFDAGAFLLDCERRRHVLFGEAMRHLFKDIMS
jgi:hypothetical protein